MINTDNARVCSLTITLERQRQSGTHTREIRYDTVVVFDWCSTGCTEPLRMARRAVSSDSFVSVRLFAAKVVMLKKEKVHELRAR